MRRVLAAAALSLGAVAAVLVAVPWLRAFRPADAGVPLVAAALLGLGIGALAGRLTRGRLWLGALVDLTAFVVFGLTVVLRGDGVGVLLDGLVHGPAQLLSVALPLVSPRSLLVAPVALVWLAAALAGECLGRGWRTPLPYAGLLVAFGLGYAATARAGGIGTTHDALLAGALVLTLLLLRAVEVARERGEAEPQRTLPLRPLGLGITSALGVALAAGLVAQSGVFGTVPTQPQRRPAVDLGRPLSPVAFVAGLRPTDASAPGEPVFTVRTDGPSSGYFALASVDYYDGAGWSFSRTFRPSGGVLPGRGSDATVGQHYRIADGPLSGAPWLPVLGDPREVGGVAVNVDADSGMVVPARALRAGDSYTVRSTRPVTGFTSLPATAVPDTTTSAGEVQLPPFARDRLARLVAALAADIGVGPSPAMPFLQALQEHLQRDFALVGAAPSVSPSMSPGGSPAPSSPAPSPSGLPGARAGSAAFADVLASIGGSQRAGTPEQYATLVALVARQLGVPARVVAGFRVQPPDDGARLPAGRYEVTTAQAWTWVEIAVAGSGWVVLDAAPGRYAEARPRPSVAAASPPTPTSTPTPEPLRSQADGGHAVADPSKVPAAEVSTRVLLLVITALVALLAVVGLGGLVLRKPLRARRRRRIDDPRLQLLGAWQEGLDVLAEAGLNGLAPLTGTEVAAATAQRFGADAGVQAGELAALAGTALFSEHAAPDGSQAQGAWRTQRELRRAVRRVLTRRERLRAALRRHR